MAEEKVIVGVGSLNAAKLQAVKDAVESYQGEWWNQITPPVRGLEVASGVPHQPRGLKEIMAGATHRAQRTFELMESKRGLNVYETYLAVGLESGVFWMPGETEEGGEEDLLSVMMDLCACCICDGENIYTGLSSAFEIPQILQVELNKPGTRDMSQAVLKIGLTDDPNIGSNQGIVGLLTRGRLTRTQQAKQAVIPALGRMFCGDVYGRRG